MLNNTLIIGLSGKKQSGKTTLCDKLYLSFICKNSHLDIKRYSFADALKKKVCMEILGLSYSQCYGTDEQKNTSTPYKWERLPKEIRDRNNTRRDVFFNGEIMESLLPSEYITAREIMQLVGTEIFRNYFDPEIWIKTTFRDIEKDSPKIALISDVRFPEEVDATIHNGGHIIRLLRNTCINDPHPSEISLDNYDFASWGERVCIIDNRDMSIEEKDNIALQYVEKIADKLVY